MVSWRNVGKKQILRFTDEQRESLEDNIVVEAPVTIFLNGEQFVTLLCTPEHLEDLAVGFLCSEGIITVPQEDIFSLKVEEDKGHIFVETKKQTGTLERLYGKRTITSGCGKGTVFYNVLDSLKSEPVETELYLGYARVRTLMKELQQRAAIFQQTGGTHSAALCTAEEVLYFCEDIGRHNAVDKIIGQCLRGKDPVEDKILAASGRLSSEILLKVAKLRIPILLSRAAPTTLSVELAEQLGITMIGFARGRRFNVYSHSWRINSG